MDTLIDKIFNDKELHKIDHNLCLLPYDLKRDIYEKYFYPNRNVKDLLEELESHRCQTLDITHLIPILKNVLEDELAIDYLLNNYVYKCTYYDSETNIFKNLYNDIMIKNKKHFILIKDPVEDFALTWVFTMYK